MDIVLVLALAGLAIIIVVGSCVGIFLWVFAKIRSGQYVVRSPRNSREFETDPFLFNNSIHTTNDGPSNT
ncbi:hypothetical protein [Nocardioides sp. 616]|uniref:hypothetical protein n=1 Tax=Nocardioides sp. 616 TaxID=2268090 RepID=UPI000CE48C95|nr:hypothetical protein [Nocardioides sp. 616]